jgi:hypothetical protein
MLFSLYLMIVFNLAKSVQLADHYGSPKCCTYTMDSIHKTEWGPDLQAEILATLLLFRVGLEGMPEFTALKMAMMTGLLGHFAELSLMMSDDGKRSQWCKLTWPVVVAVLQDPLVQIDNEDTVVWAIDTWQIVNAVDPTSTMYMQVQSDKIETLRIQRMSRWV